MNFLESVPAIRRIETDRDDLFAIDVVGHVSAADGENLFGLLEAAYALHPAIDVLVRLVDHDGVDWADIAGRDPETGHRPCPGACRPLRGDRRAGLDTRMRNASCRLRRPSNSGISRPRTKQPPGNGSAPSQPVQRSLPDGAVAT